MQSINQSITTIPRTTFGERNQMLGHLQNREDKWTQTKEDKEEKRFQHNRS
jgi:hypothetical protein